MTQTADTLHCNKVTGKRTAVPQRVEGSNPRAEQRCCFNVTETFRYRCQRLHGSHHVLLVSPVIADAGNFQIPAIAKISAPARQTRAILAPVPSNTDTLSLLPLGNIGTHFIDDAGHLMSGNARILNSGPCALFREHITVAHTTGLHLDPHVSCTRLRNLALDDLEISSGTGDLRYLHRCYCDCCSCHGCLL